MITNPPSKSIFQLLQKVGGALGIFNNFEIFFFYWGWGGGRWGVRGEKYFANGVSDFLLEWLALAVGNLKNIFSKRYQKYGFC